MKQSIAPPLLGITFWPTSTNYTYDYSGNKQLVIGWNLTCSYRSTIFLPRSYPSQVLLPGWATCWYFLSSKKNWCWVWGGTPHGDLPDLGSIHFDKTTDNVSSFNLILKKIVLVIIVGTFCQVNELTFLYTTLLGFVYPLHRFMR